MPPQTKNTSHSYRDARHRIFFHLFFAALLGCSTLHCFAAQPRVCEIDPNVTHPNAPGIPYSPSCTTNNIAPENIFCLEPSLCERVEQRSGPYTCLVKRCVQVLLDETGKPYPLRELHACYPTGIPKEPLKGNCRLGQRISILNGAGLSPCTKAITPVPLKTVENIQDETKRCARTDEDCDGLPDPPAKDCPCGPVGTTRYCYPGSRNDDKQTQGSEKRIDFIACMEGIQVCEADPESNTLRKGFWGECKGFRLPSTNPCSGLDGDCDGKIDAQTTERFCIRQNAGAASIDPITASKPVNDRGDSQCTVDGGLDVSLRFCGECTEGELRACDYRVRVATTDKCTQTYQKCEKVNNEIVWSSCRYDEAGKATYIRGDNAIDWFPPQAETLDTCNNKDDDCDGYIDNFPGTKADYTLRLGCNSENGDKSEILVNSVSFGFRQFCGWRKCDGTRQEVCTAIPEECNGKDDDCDGLIDNILPDGKTEQFCSVDTPNGKVLGAYFCENGKKSDVCKPVEICNNGKDDNNNGITDQEPCLLLNLK